MLEREKVKISHLHLLLFISQHCSLYLTHKDESIYI